MLGRPLYPFWDKAYLLVPAPDQIRFRTRTREFDSLELGLWGTTGEVLITNRCAG